MNALKLWLGVLLIFISMQETALSQTYTWPENGHTYKLIPSCSWTSCRSTALGLGGDLVIINSAAENAMLYNTFTTASEFYIGATDSSTEGTWKWVDGSTFCTGSNCEDNICEAGFYCNWRSSEPNDSGNEDYGVLVRFSGGTWNDWSSPLPAVVEIDCSSNPVLFLDGNYTENGTEIYENKTTLFASRGETDYYKIGETGNVHLKAEQKITLGIGFSVVEGGTFKAEIDNVDCI